MPLENTGQRDSFVTVDLPGSGLADSLPDKPYYESYFVHWLEMMGYDLTYSTKKETVNAERQTTDFRPSRIQTLKLFRTDVVRG